MSPNYDPHWVSVIIPTWNRASLVRDTLQSVFAQDYRPIEIVVVDDGSTDTTKEEVMAFKTAHASASFIIKVLSQYHEGASVARNTGLEHCTGQYIQFLDSDDLLHPDKLAVQVRALETYQVSFVWSESIRFNRLVDWKAASFIGRAKEGMNIDHALVEFIKRSLWRTESGLYTRACCISTGPWKPVVMFQDWEYNIRMLSRRPGIKFVPGSYTAARVHDQGRIGDLWSTEKGLRGILDVYQVIESNLTEMNGSFEGWRDALVIRYEDVVEKAQEIENWSLETDAKKELDAFKQRSGIRIG